MTKTENEQLAARLRELARGYERDEYIASCRGGFTCNVVVHYIGSPAGKAYANLFEFDWRHRDPDQKVPNAEDLWAHPAEEERDIRILLLCFAAALAEAGDLMAFANEKGKQ